MQDNNLCRFCMVILQGRACKHHATERCVISELVSWVIIRIHISININCAFLLHYHFVAKNPVLLKSFNNPGYYLSYDNDNKGIIDTVQRMIIPRAG